MTSFNILAVRSGESDDTPLYPIPGDAADSVELATSEHAPLTLAASELAVLEVRPGSNAPKQIVHVRKMKAAVMVTDQRVAVACSKYEKGGGWTPWSIGAVPVALASNVGSKLLAARRRRGKMLVGQVRYPHLMTVGFRRTGGLKAREQLRLGTFDPTLSGFRGLLLDITLQGNQSGSSLAQQIAGQAARYRLDSDEALNDATRQALEALREPPTLSYENKQFSSYSLIGKAGGGT